MGEIINVYKVLVGKPERFTLLRTPGHRSEGNIRIDCREMGWRLWSRFIWLRIGTSGGLL
jgi:hypothetical protein